MAKSSAISAGVIVWRRAEPELEVLIVHPGGPFFVNKDEGAWSIPKGEPKSGEDLLECARREFAEEIGLTPPGRHATRPGDRPCRGKPPCNCNLTRSI